AGVASRPRVLRSSRRTPSRSSSARSCLLTAGWPTPSERAAAEIDPCSKTRRKHSSWRRRSTGLSIPTKNRRSLAVAATERAGALPSCGLHPSIPSFASKVNMSIYQRLQSLAIELPAVTPPVAAFVPFVRSDRLVFLSGHIAKRGGEPWVG